MNPIQQNTKSSSAILVGNSFPLSLIRRRVLIEPVPLERFQEACSGAEIYSFWGHANTIRAAADTFGINLSPRETRPAIELNPENLPTLHGMVFTECWILSPIYKTGFRPKIGEEVDASSIVGWQVLYMTWK